MSLDITGTNHDYLVLVKEFPFVKFEIKGYYYPDEPYVGSKKFFYITKEFIK